MPDQVPEDVKDERLQRLQALLRAQQEAFNRACVGQVLPVLFEKPGRQPRPARSAAAPYLQAVHVDGAGGVDRRASSTCASTRAGRTAWPATVVQDRCVAARIPA